MLLVDAEGRVEDANGVARELFGSCVGLPCRDVVGVHDDVHRTGCRGTCARELAMSDSATRTAVGVIAGGPHRVSCAGMGDYVVVVVSRTGELPAVAEPLTPREREVLGLVAEGLSSARIAKRLGISAATVRTHVEHVREKLGSRTRAEAVARANALGLV